MLAHPRMYHWRIEDVVGEINSPNSWLILNDFYAIDGFNREIFNREIREWVKELYG